MTREAQALADALSGVTDEEIRNLPYEDEVELCEDLAPIIEKYGLATVRNALDAITQANTWKRGTA